MGMAKANRRDPVVRYLLAQLCLSAAVGFVFGGMMLAADINGIRTMLSAGHPAEAVIVLGSAVMTFLPVVMATSVGLLAWEPRD
jgi:hypothetical protein